MTDGGGWWHYDGGLTDFLAGFLGGRVSCPLLPDLASRGVHVAQYASADRLPRR